MAYPDEAWLAIPEEDRFEERVWHFVYFQAFDALQFDRATVEAMERPIFYAALSRYCDDHGIVGAARRRFMIFINAVDAEYLKFASERVEAARKKLAKPGAADAQP